MATKKETVDAMANVEAVDASEPMQSDTPTQHSSAPDTSGFCVYLGPSIRGVIQSGTIYPGTLDKTLSTLSTEVARYPLIASLIVSGDTLPEDRIKVKTAGNLLHVNYMKLADGKNE